jgi:hypothetical protein
VASGWQNKLLRISRMDWEELRVRAEQEFHKQSDLLVHRLNVRPAPIRSIAESETPSARFFFSASDVSQRAELLRTHLPAEVSAILREGDEIGAHRFRLLGYENLEFSSDSGSSDAHNINWHLDPLHGKYSPLEPWFRIPFLDFAVVGDHKVMWELNRHQHFVTLAKASLLSGDEKYGRELIKQWRNWIHSNPYPLGINWGSSLEVAFRSLSWIWVDQLLAETSVYSGFRAELAPALGFHGRYIERYLSTYFSPNTHLLGEAVALFFLGTLYPQLPRASFWKESGWKILLHEARRQVRSDGVYFEQSLHYHVYALDFFLYARLLAAQNGQEIPPEYDAVIKRMLDVVAALSQAGPPEGFGDDDGGRLWNPRRNRTEHMTDPLAVGAVMYDRRFPAAKLTEEAIWLFGDQAVETLGRISSLSQQGSPLEDPHSVAFPDGGLYVLAASKPYAQTMVVDSGPQGVGRSGHGHADALSLRLTMDGRRWLVDSGSGVYISGDPADRNTFRGTGAHNTVRVDRVDQAQADEPFSWTCIPTTQTENWTVGRTFTYFVGSHNGYERLADPVVHRRYVLKIDGSAWLVRDVVVGQAEHEIETRWHFAPDLEIRNAGSGRFEVTRADATSPGSALNFFVPTGTVWATAAEIGITQLSPAYGAIESAPLIRCHARVLLPAETAAALLPVRREIEHDEFGRANIDRVNESKADPRLTSIRQEAVQAYELDYHDHSERHGFIFALGNEAWNFGPWSSDARVLSCRIQEGQLANLVVIGGTYVDWQGQSLLRLAGAPGIFEWSRQDIAANTALGAVSDRAVFAELTAQHSTIASSFFGDATHRNPSPYVEKH